MAAEPLLPLAWLRRRNVTAPIVSQLFANFSYMGGFILTPILLQEGLGYTAAAVGFLIIFRPLTFALTAPSAGRITLRLGERVSAGHPLLELHHRGGRGVEAAMALCREAVAIGDAPPPRRPTILDSVR